MLLYLYYSDMIFPAALLCGRPGISQSPYLGAFYMRILLCYINWHLVIVALKTT